MPSTFGSIIVHFDDGGYHILHTPPKNVAEGGTRRMHYAGPRVIMREVVGDLDTWLAARKKEGFTFRTE